MSILVLGGAGYIGSHTVKQLIDAGYQTVVADNLQTGHKKAVHPEAELYIGDIRAPGFLDDIFKQEDISCVIHFAADSLVGESMRNPLKYYRNNVDGALSLIESMVAHNIRNIVFSSTAATYGEPKSCPITESSETQPTNPYGETKLAMEKIFKWADVAYGIRFVSLRYFNACGADLSGEIGEDHKTETHLIPLILQVANAKREYISIYGSDYPTTDGTCIRDYIHVTDLADAHILATKYLEKGNPSDIFNLGNGEGFSVREIIEESRNVTGHPIPVKVDSRRAGDPAVLIASNAKARQVLGWQPQFDDINTILSTAWNWHKNHPEGFSL